MPTNQRTEFDRVFDGLKRIVEPYAREFPVTYDSPTGHGTHRRAMRDAKAKASA